MNKNPWKKWNTIFFVVNAMMTIHNALMLFTPGYQWLNIFAVIVGLSATFITSRHV